MADDPLDSGAGPGTGTAHAGAGGHPHAGAGDLATEAKKTDHKTAVIVVVSIVGVIIAWMTFRKSGSSSSAAGAVTAPTPYLGVGQVAGAATTTPGTNPGPADPNAAGFAAMLANMQTSLNAIVHNTTPTGASTATPIPSQHTPAPLPHPVPVQRTIQPTPKPVTHSYAVQRGDNLTVIAQRQGVTLAALEAANPQIKNPNLIYAGQSITVPK